MNKKPFSPILKFFLVVVGVVIVLGLAAALSLGLRLD